MTLINREKTVEDQVVEIYTRYRRRIHPDWVPSLKKAGVWVKVASLIHDLQADPRLYVEAQFELGYAQRGESAIFPEALGSSKAIETYREYQLNFRSIPERTVQQEMRLLASAMSGGGLSQQEAIAHPAVNLAPWFRILACSEQALPEITAKYLGAALAELQRDPDLSTFLKTRFHDRYQSRIWTAVPGPAGHPHHSVPSPSEPTYIRPSLGRGI